MDPNQYNKRFGGGQKIRYLQGSPKALEDLIMRKKK